MDDKTKADGNGKEAVGDGERGEDGVDGGGVWATDHAVVGHRTARCQDAATAGAPRGAATALVRAARPGGDPRCGVRVGPHRLRRQQPWCVPRGQEETLASASGSARIGCVAAAEGKGEGRALELAHTAGPVLPRCGGHDAGRGHRGHAGGEGEGERAAFGPEKMRSFEGVWEAAAWRVSCVEFVFLGRVSVRCRGVCVCVEVSITGRGTDGQDEAAT